MFAPAHKHMSAHCWIDGKAVLQQELSSMRCAARHRDLKHNVMLRLCGALVDVVAAALRVCAAVRASASVPLSRHVVALEVLRQTT